MKFSINNAFIGLLIVLSPLLIIAMHYHNRLEQFAMDQTTAFLHFLNVAAPTAEDFAASQGGAQVQIVTSHVASEEEVMANLINEKRQVTKDILSMTEPELFPGPKPVYK